VADLSRVTVWADALIRLHLDADQWSFAFDNAKKRAGLCDYAKKRISVSRYLAARWSDDDVHQILLHELAHALAGPAAGHGPLWRRTAHALGYVGKRTHDGETAVDLAPWVGTCPNGHLHYRHRRPTRALSCAKCSRSFSRAFLITWTKREIPAAVRRRAAAAVAD
jgi:hypothetical protein